MHHAVVVSNTERARRFYIDVLGMQDDDADRAKFNITFPGAFVKAGPSQIHLMEVKNVDQTNDRQKPYL